MRTPPEKTTVDESWNLPSREALIEAIVERFHEPQYDAMDRLSEALHHLQTRHGQRWDDWLGRLRNEWEPLVRQLSGHFRREETVLFPLLALEGELPPLDGPIADIMGEHVDELALLDRLSAATGNYTPPADACPATRELVENLRAFDEAVRRHIQVEDQALFGPLLENRD